MRRGGSTGSASLARGENDDGCIVHVPDVIDVKAIRKRTHMSQGEFSRNYGFSKRTDAPHRAILV